MASIVPTVRSCSARFVIRNPRYASRSFRTSVGLRKQGPGTGENFEQANDPQPPKDTPNVSLTDQTPTTSMGARDAPLQEMESDGEKKRELQAPNRAGIWSRNQQPREVAMSGPRFEQTIMDAQVRSTSYWNAYLLTSIAATVGCNRAHTQTTRQMGGWAFDSL